MLLCRLSQTLRLCKLEQPSQGCCESLFSLSSLFCGLQINPHDWLDAPSSAVRAALSLSSLSPLSYTASQVRAVRESYCVSITETLGGKKAYQPSKAQKPLL
jgi:hypothetical protein